MYDMLVSTPSCADQGVQDGTPPMGKEHQLIGSDHRAAVIHCDIYARPGLDSPTMPRDDVKLSIRKATSDLEKGEHSRIADALMREVEGFMAKSPTVVDHARDNSLDTRVRQMGVKYADAKKKWGGCAESNQRLLQCARQNDGGNRKPGDLVIPQAQSEGGELVACGVTRCDNPKLLITAQGGNDGDDQRNMGRPTGGAANPDTRTVEPLEHRSGATERERMQHGKKPNDSQPGGAGVRWERQQKV